MTRILAISSNILNQVWDFYLTEEELDSNIVDM
jgi:hypothetical protein